MRGYPPPAAVLVALAACAGAYGRLETNVVFRDYTALASNDEIARRALPPVTHRRIAKALAERHQKLADQAIDLAREKFDIYIPPGRPPPGGWGLLVFVAPWQDPTRPDVWRAPLDRHQLIFVSPQRAGNGTSTLDHRIPLALLAYANVRARYPIDASRVYVSGMSGGSRVAEMIALAYPDIFHGAILDAGADAIDGRTGMYKPPAELFRLFQRTRLVYITGDQDTEVMSEDNLSLDSMRDACVLNVDTEDARGLAHQALDQPSLEKALRALEAPHAIDEAELARCNARVAAELTAKLDEIAALIARGDGAAARDRINAIDAHYGGLAAPRVLELDAAATALP